MIRIIAREQDVSAAVCAGGQAETSMKTFEVDLPDLEKWLREAKQASWKYCTREIIGAELIN